MFSFTRRLPHALTFVLAALAAGQAARAADTTLARGHYLTTIMGCNDCHTAGSLTGQPDMTHALSGGDVGFAVPKLGIFYAPNLTPDNETGLGTWTEAEIVTAITTGRRPDGRILAPIMPVKWFKSLKPDDAAAIAAYLKSLPPVSHKVPGPLGPGEKPPLPYFELRIPADYKPAPAPQ